MFMFSYIDDAGRTHFGRGAAHPPNATLYSNNDEYRAAINDASSNVNLAFNSELDKLLDYAKILRKRVESQGVTVGDNNYASGRDQMSILYNLKNLLQESKAPSVNFKALTGWVVLTKAQLSEVSLAIATHVQTCFNKERDVDAAIRSGSIKTTTQIDQEFSSL